MRAHVLIAASALCFAQTAEAAPRPTPCDGYFTSPEQGYTLGPGGSLVASGPVVPDGTTIRFSAMRKIRGKFLLFQARSPIVFDAATVDITHGCLLPEH